MEGSKKPDWWMVILTAIIGILTAVNVVVYFRESEGAANQTSQLIDAANIQACAATKNATSAATSAQAASDLARETGAIAKRSIGQIQAMNSLAVQAERSANTAEAALNVQARPWVGPEDLKESFRSDPITFDKDGNAAVRWAILLKNFGNFPAQNIHVGADLMITQVAGGVLYQHENMRCRDSADERLGFVVFPGPDGFERYWGSATRPSEFVRNPNTTFPNDFVAFMSGCITYRDQSGIQHYTGFTYRLVDPNTNENMVVHPTRSATLPAGRWALWHSFVDHEHRQ